MSRLRLALTIPGAVSLGDYEGGALAALLVALKSLGENVAVVDVIAAASAGSITGLLTARALVDGVDPVDLMAGAWVDKVSISTLRTRSTDSPLSAPALDKMADQLLGPGGPQPGTPIQHVPVRLSMALTNLAGLNYRIAKLTDGADAASVVTASTYLDWYTLQLAPGTGKYEAEAKFALASGANALGFPPRRLNRKKDERAYERAGLEGFPDDGEFWYTDGGTVDNEPLGRTIDLVQEAEHLDPNDDHRLFLLIHLDGGPPDPSAPSPWKGKDTPLPSWVKTALRALKATKAQSIYEDLKRLEKTNTYLRWVERIPAAVESGLENGMASAGLTKEQGDAVRSGLAQALAQARGELADRREHLDKSEKRGTPRRDPAPAAGVPDLLAAAIVEATGLAGRQALDVEVVSPVLESTLESSTTSGGQPLAGTFLFHFGGFFDLRFRQSDFDVGWRSMRAWIADVLPGYLPDPSGIPEALKEVDRRFDEVPWRKVNEGGAGLRSLTWTERWQALRLLGHIVRVVLHDLRSGQV